MGLEPRPVWWSLKVKEPQLALLAQGVRSDREDRRDLERLSVRLVRGDRLDRQVPEDRLDLLGRWRQVLRLLLGCPEVRQLRSGSLVASQRRMLWQVASTRS